MINKWLGITNNASEHGIEIDHMLEFCHWFMAVLLVFWSCFFVYCLWRFNRHRQPRADYKGLRSKFSTHLEVSVVLIEAVLLLGFALPLWATRVDEAPAEGTLVVNVVAEAFGWNFHYPGEDGIFARRSPDLVSASNPIGIDFTDPNSQDDFVSRTEMHAPVGRPLVARITSRDVIHNFALPHMRMSQDAIPGMLTPVWFTPKVPGEYEIICAQLCGAGHYSMKGWFFADTAEDYQAWAAQRLQATQQLAQGLRAEQEKMRPAAPPAAPTAPAVPHDAHGGGHSA